MTRCSWWRDIRTQPLVVNTDQTASSSSLLVYYKIKNVDMTYQSPLSPSLLPKKSKRWRRFIFLNLIHKMSLFFWWTSFLKKTIFDIMFMLNFTCFLLNTFLKKLPFWGTIKHLFNYGFLEIFWLYSEHDFRKPYLNKSLIVPQNGNFFKNLFNRKYVKFIINQISKIVFCKY